MAYCTECGNRVEMTATFCDRCGARLSPPGALVSQTGRLWAGAILGAVIAFALFLLVNYILVSVSLGNIIAQIPPAERPPESFVRALRRALLHFSVYSDHLLPFHLSGSVAVNSISGTIELSLWAPLFGGLVFVGLPLLFAGYLAGRMSRARTPQEGLYRGGLVAIPYTLLLLLSLKVLPLRYEDQQVPVGELVATLSLTARPSVLGAIVSGLILGAVCGSVGGLWSAGGSVRQTIKDFLKARLPTWMPAAYGACVSLVVGLALAAVVIPVGLIVGLEDEFPPEPPKAAAEYRLSPVDYLYLAVWAPPSLAVLGYPLLHGVGAGFELSFTGPATVSGRGGVSLLSRSAESVVRIGEERDRVRLPGWVYLGLLVPLVALVIGGRAAGTLGQGQPPAATGLRFALVYALLLASIWYFSQVGLSGSGSFTVSSLFGSESFQARWSVEAGYSLLLAMLVGFIWAAVFGTLGVIWSGATRRFCDSCGARLRPGITFCDQCGARVA